MSKKVLILSGSPRKNGNSDILCDEFMRGAIEAGNQVEKIRVAEKKVGYCRACYACKETGVCAIKDDMAEILQKMIDADVIVLASPVYFYSIDAQLKAVIDRTVARWLEVRDKVMNREKYDANKSNLPDDFVEGIINGGCHAYFGMYGAQDGDGTPMISCEEQINTTADGILKLME